MNRFILNSLSAVSLLASMAGAVLPFELSQIVRPESDTAPSRFGWRVGIVSGSVLIFTQGGWSDDSVWHQDRLDVYKKSGGFWSPAQQILASGENSMFGQSVAWDSNQVAVGAVQEYLSGSFGAVHVYEVVSGELTQRAIVLNPEDYPQGFARSVAIEGDLLAVGSAYERVYIYERVQGVWTLTNTLIAPVPRNGDEFGAAVALDHGMLIVGAPGYRDPNLPDSINNCGGIFTFVKSSDVWQFSGSNSPGAPYGRFGNPIVASDGVIVAGTEGPNFSLLFTNQDARVFRHIGNELVLEDVFLDMGGERPNSGFATALATDSHTIVVGSPTFPPFGPHMDEAAYIYQYADGIWSYPQRFPMAHESHWLLGSSTAVSGDVIVVGDPDDETNPTARGAVYILERPTTGCPGDFNLDGQVDDNDFVIFVAAYNLGAVPPADPRTDLNADNLINDDDFILFCVSYNDLYCP